MKNVYDVRREQNLNFILDTDCGLSANEKILSGEMAVIIHLYYPETIDYYFDYIKSIPKEADVYISISNENTKKEVNRCIAKHNIDNCVIIEKDNRGRDVSSLLVACRTIILKYKYVCFLHDKKATAKIVERDTEKWIFSIWSSLLGGKKEYIYHIKKVFENNPDLGLLTPPEPMGEHLSTMFGDSWGSDFECANELVKKWELKCDIQRSIPPISFGTAFWCKVDALRKIFELEWGYEDFPEEPMPIDGTISHAIERIFPYVAQDAGYTTGCVMTTEYAGMLKEEMQYLLRAAFKWLDDEWEISCLADVNYWNRKKEDMIRFFDCYEEVYLYGAGGIGKRCLEILRDEGREPKGILVSQCNDENSVFRRVPVTEFSERHVNEKIGIIVAVRKEICNEVIARLMELNTKQYMVVLN